MNLLAVYIYSCDSSLVYIYIYIYKIDIYLDVVIVMTQEFRSSFRLLQTTELLVGTVFPLLSTIPHYVMINNLLPIYIYIYIYIYIHEARP